jgi:hypothetical protein
VRQNVKVARPCKQDSGFRIQDRNRPQTRAGQATAGKGSAKPVAVHHGKGGRELNRNYLGGTDFIGVFRSSSGLSGGKGSYRQLSLSGLGHEPALATMGVSSEWRECPVRTSLMAPV